VSIVVAVKRVDAALLDLLRGLREARFPLPYEVILVAATNDHGTLSEIRNQFPLVLVYTASAYLEQGALYDIGVKAAGGKHLLLLDSTAHPTAATLTEMVRFADNGQFIGAVVPRYVTASGADRPACRFFPRPITACLEAIGFSPTYPKLNYAFNRLVTTPKEVDAAEAGCVLIRRAAILDVGGLSTGYPAGGEIWDWCMRARLKGWTVFLQPGNQAIVTSPDLPYANTDKRAAVRRFIYRFYGWVPSALLAIIMLPCEVKDRWWRRKQLDEETLRPLARA
jgi:GT2 family glycosyltransferase